MKVLMLIKTSGLIYDDRLRKEVLALSEMGHAVEIVALEHANEQGSGVVYGNVQARTLSLRTRNWLPKARLLWIKTVELYIWYVLELLRNRYDIVWIHNFENGGMIPIVRVFQDIGRVKRIVWDQHELLPTSMFRNTPLRTLLLWLNNSCDVVIGANEERIEWLRAHFGGKPISETVVVLHNYPDRVFAERSHRPLPASVQEWLGGSEYVLAQGGAARNRNFAPLVEAVMALEDVRLIVIGPFQAELNAQFSERYGPAFAERIHFTGYIPQMDIINYIDRALCSIVLYKMSNENNRLCAPNRLYQAVVRGTPVVAGSNPPMKRFVEKHQCGIVLEGDGRNPADIQAGIMECMGRAGFYRQNALATSKKILWESQYESIRQAAGMRRQVLQQSN